MPGTPAEPLIHLQDVSCERGDRLLFRGLSLSLNRGSCVRLLGANGSGKTTCLRGIAGLHGRLEGEVRCNGPLLFLGHRSGVSGRLTVAENLSFRAALSGIGKLAAREVRQALHAVDLMHSAEVPVWQLSAGQQRRVSLGLLFLAAVPDLWILDEPFTSLDADGLDKLTGRIASHCDTGGAVLFTSHQAPGHLLCETVTLPAVGAAA